MSPENSAGLLSWALSLSSLFFGLICFAVRDCRGAGSSDRRPAWPAWQVITLISSLRFELHECHFLDRLHLLPDLSPNHNIWYASQSGLSPGQPVVLATRLRLYESLWTAKGLSRLFTETITP